MNEWFILIVITGSAALIGASLTDSAIRGWHCLKRLIEEIDRCR